MLQNACAVSRCSSTLVRDHHAKFFLNLVISLGFRKNSCRQGAPSARLSEGYLTDICGDFCVRQLIVKQIVYDLHANGVGCTWCATI